MLLFCIPGLDPQSLLACVEARKEVALTAANSGHNAPQARRSLYKYIHERGDDCRMMNGKSGSKSVHQMLVNK